MSVPLTWHRVGFLGELHDFVRAICEQHPLLSCRVMESGRRYVKS